MYFQELTYPIPMYHQPSDYTCPFCEWLGGTESDYKRNSDIVFQDDSVTAFISPKWWINNPGHVIVIPNHHYENIYSLPSELIADVHKVAQKIAIAMRASYNCTGTSLRQHNEPDGNQDVWHFHVHVFPRFPNDELYKNHDHKAFVSPEERIPYAQLLKAALAKLQ